MARTNEFKLTGEVRSPAKTMGPRALRTSTESPSAIPRSRASSGWRKTDGPCWRRRSISDWLKDEFRKNRLGGTMHCSG